MQRSDKTFRESNLERDFEKSPAGVARFGGRDVVVGGAELGILSDATECLGDFAALRQRLSQDGYLLLRGLHDPSLVLRAREQMLERLEKAGALDPNFPRSEAHIASAGTSQFRGGTNELTACSAFQELVRGERVLDFFSGLRGGPALSYDYQWLRVVGRGDYTGAHFDVVYMGRGTHQLLTLWTPLGKVSYRHGPLAICAGSHTDPRFLRVRETYGKMDVDRDRVAGWFSNDPFEIRDRFGGRWATTEFEPGDALVFGIFTLHASLTNVSDEYRLSSDTRYQLESEACDERWVGRNPKGHYAWHAGPQVSMADKRAEWGV